MPDKTKRKGPPPARDAQGNLRDHRYMIRLSAVEVAAFTAAAAAQRMPLPLWLRVVATDAAKRGRL